MADSAGAGAPILFYLVFVLVLGIAAYFWREAARLRDLNTELTRDGAQARARLESAASAAQERDAARLATQAALAEAASAKEALAALRAGDSARSEAAAERERALLAMKAEFEKNFSALASDALSRNEQRFLALANETFEKHQAAAQGQVKDVVKPVEETFTRLAESVAALDKARTEDKAALNEQMRALAVSLKDTQDGTGKLVNALRAAPKTRGRWGEETLRNVLELAGLVPHVDFHEQNSVDGEAGKLRPDVTIRLPGGRVIVVDSKVALSGYLDAFEAVDEAVRESFLKRHAAQLREHVKMLASKDYWRHVPESADFVALFVPGENFFAAAAERDPDLFEYAITNKVIIVTPATLVALAKAVAFGWRQEEAGKNAKAVAELGRELYQRLARMGEAVGGLGKAMESGVKKYNELVGSLEARVLPQARRLRDMGAGDPALEIAPLEPIEIAPRRLASGRDLLTGSEARDG
mgnify:CR=1 FL=1